MIDISKLDPGKTYIGYEVGTNKVAKKIQSFCKKDMDNLFGATRPKEHEIATHLFALVWNNEVNNWVVYESHFTYDGVRKLEYNTWLQMQKKDFAKEYFVFPFELSVPALDFYEKYNPGYGSGQIESMSIGEIIKRGGLSWIDYPGVTSSEYIALCDVDYKICNKFCLLPYEIKPIHFQAYVHSIIGREHLVYGSN